ncbi:tumor necrosis factor receptor superfamily member 19L [Gadus macrocephalus]|uniref:tumor necrosis factor receptor superfamily member 19L n=1 Tax=Gadus macrocephalus TaxID=80720 RepID=UPI0028CB3BD8|nr:tumor necrosis factor receptor superfamily member 19L [Gadus macrocephalus]XP_059931476.1 tumor necrosis factor receptor superfamily member 19L [Gadus macrocephalus]XP_059931477.1 tumor necrosis factor receptor superfamily member 19L [Gadus macrocephalus]
MMNHLCCSALVLLTVLDCGGTAAVQCRWGEACMCLQCPAGQQPSKACGQVQAPATDVQCQACPQGTFADALDSELCRPHASCMELKRQVATPGSAVSDTVCGGCLPGFNPSSVENDGPSKPCVEAGPAGHVRAVRTAGSGPASTGGRLANGTAVRGAEEKTAEYAVFALVPVFCVMGLLGILICNILKKKGYRCTAEKEGGDEETATPEKEAHGCPYIPDDPNEDTISVLVRLITEKKENAAALEELLLEYETSQMAMNKSSSIKFPKLSPLAQFRSLPRLCPHQSHLHTISGLSGLFPRHGYRCSRCAQRKWPAILIPPLEALKDHPLKPPQSLILPYLDAGADTQKSPLLGGVCADEPRPQAAVPKATPQKVGESFEGGKEKKKEGEPTVLSVGRFQVAQITENRPVTVETKASTQEQRNSLFGGNPFSSLSGVSRR